MKKDIKRDELIGAVKYQNQWHIFAEYFAWWVLDYPAYSPSILQEKDRQDFRDGLLVVNPSNGKEFLETMKDQELAIETLKQIVAEQGSEEVPLTYVIDFDDQRFVDGYSELDIAEYVPKGWKSVEDFPLNYVPDEIKSVWTQNNN